MDLAQFLHNQDNPGNLVNLLDQALRTGINRVLPAVIPTSASNRSVVTETPGSTPSPSPNQISDSNTNPNDPLRRFGPIIAGVVALILLVAAVVRGGK